MAHNSVLPLTKKQLTRVATIPPAGKVDANFSTARWEKFARSSPIKFLGARGSKNALEIGVGDKFLCVFTFPESENGARASIRNLPSHLSHSRPVQEDCFSSAKLQRRETVTGHTKKA